VEAFTVPTTTEPFPDTARAKPYMLPGPRPSG